MQFWTKYTFSLIFILAGSFALCLINQSLGHNWGGDFALYIHQAKSVVEGTMEQLAAENQYIVAQSSVHRFSPTLYPWGFPLLLAPVYALFGINFIAFKVVEALFWVGALFMLYLTFKSNGRLNPVTSLLILGIMGFHQVYIQATNNVLSGIPFLFFAFLSLYFILRLLETPHQKWWLPVLTGVLLFFSYSIRTEGAGLFIALLVGQVQHFFTHKNFKKHVLFYSLPYLSALVLFGVSKLLLPTGFTSHLGYASMVSWETSIENIEAYYHWITNSLFKINLIPFFGFIAVSIASIGIVIRIKKDLVLVTFLLFLVALFTVWPFHNLRYLFVLFPLLLYFFAQGMWFFVRISKESPTVKYLSYLLLAICLTSNIAHTAVATLQALRTEKRMVNGPETKESRELFAYIKHNTQKEDVIAFFRPRVMHLYTNRISLALFHSKMELKKKADYIVEARKMGSFYQIPIAHLGGETDPDLELIFTNNDFIIYRIVQ